MSDQPPAEEISQGDLADKLEVSKAAISRFENGHDLPSPETVKRIAKFFQVSRETFGIYVLREIAERMGLKVTISYEDKASAKTSKKAG